MASIAELRKQISQRKTQASEARAQAQKQKESIPKTSKKQLLVERRGLKGRQYQRGLSEQRTQVEGVLQQVTGFEQETQKAEQEIEAYLRTDQGKLQYAKESGLKPSRYIYRKIARGYESKAVPVYSTPYGEVIDEQFWEAYKGRALEKEAKLQSIASKNIQEMGFSSPKAFYKALEEGKLSEGQIRKGGIDPRALQIKENIMAKAEGREAGKLQVAQLGKGLTIEQARGFSAKELAQRRKATGLPAVSQKQIAPKIETKKDLQLISDSKDLSIVNGTKRDELDINGTTRDSGRTPSKIRSTITGFVSRVVGDKEDFEENFQEITVGDKTFVAAKQPVFGTGDIGVTGQVSPTRVVVQEKIEVEPVSFGRQLLFATTAPAIIVEGAARTGGYWSEKGVLKLFETTAPEYEGITIKERKVKVTEPQFGTLQTNPLTGEQVRFKEKELLIPEKKVLTPEQVAKIVGVGTEVGTYIAADIATAGLIDLSFVSKGAQTVLKKEATTQEKIEGGFELGGGLFGLGLRGGSALLSKSKLTKQSKFLSEPDLKIVRTSPDIQTVRASSKIEVPKARVDVFVGDLGMADDISLDLLSVKKGTDITETVSRRNLITGTVEEVRGKDIGRGIFRQFDEGALEVIQFPGEITRVTKVGADGISEVSLFKKGKEISRQTVTPELFGDLGKPKTKITPFEFEKQKVPSGRTRQLEIKAGGIKRVTKDEPITLLGQKADDTTKGLFGKGERIMEQQADVGRGRFVFTETEQGLLEAVEVGKRKALTQVKGLDESIKLTEQVPQRIVRGFSGKELDIVYTKADDLFTVTKKISPTIQKRTKELLDTEQVSIFLKPGTKSKLAQELGEKEIALQRSKFGIKPRTPTVFTGDLTPKQLKATSEAVELNILARDEAIRKAQREFAMQSLDEKTIKLQKQAQEQLGKIEDVVYVEPLQFKPTKITQPESRAPISLTIEEARTRQVSPILGIAESLQPQASETQTKQEILGTSDKVLKDIGIKVSQAQASAQASSQKQQQEFKQSFKTAKLSLKLKKPKQEFKRIETTIKITPEPKPPKPKETIFPIPTRQTETIVRQGKKTVSAKDLFKVFAKKGGVDIEIGEARTEEEAFKKLSKELKGTLRASGFVERAGKKIKPVGFSSTEFRLGKSDPFRVVQRKGKRLSGRPEVSEIQFFKRTRGSQKKSKSRGFL